MRPSTLEVLKMWEEPRVYIGEAEGVEEYYLTVRNIFTKENIKLKRESEKPVPVGMHTYCFVLPDGTEENHFLAISSLIFFPTDHKCVFENLTLTQVDELSKVRCWKYSEEWQESFTKEVVAP